MKMKLTLAYILFSVSYLLTEKTFTERLKQINYDKDERPGFHSGKTTNVSVQIEFYKIGPIDESFFTFETGFYLRQWWHDHRFEANSNDTHTSIQAASMSKYIWTPDTTVADAIEIKTYDHSVGTEINQTSGMVFVGQRIKAKISCNMDLRSYPMDTQVCKLRLENYAYNSRYINTRWHHITPVQVQDGLVLDGYELSEVTWDMVQKPHQYVGKETLYWNYLNVYVTVKRTFMYHVYRVYIPSILLLSFAMGTFWVPASAVPARMGMIVTSFLSNTFILQTVTEKTVKVPYTTPMQFFLLMNVVIIVLSLLEYLLILQLNERKTAKQKAQEKIESEDINGHCSSSVPLVFDSSGVAEPNKETIFELQTRRKLSVRSEYRVRHRNKIIKIRKMHTLDVVCQIVFPLAYAIFATTYFGYYIPRQ